MLQINRKLLHVDFNLQFLESNQTLAWNMVNKARRLSLQIRSGELMYILTMSVGGVLGCHFHGQLLRRSVVNELSQKMAFLTCYVDNAIVNAIGDGNAKMPPHIHSRAH